MAESLLVGRNFVSGICKLKPLKTLKKTKNLFFYQTWLCYTLGSHQHASCRSSLHIGDPTVTSFTTFSNNEATNFDVNGQFFSKISKPTHSIHRFKTVKMSPTTLYYSECSECTDRTVGVCVHQYSICSFTYALLGMDAVHLWKNAAATVAEWGHFEHSLKWHSSQF